MSAGPADIPRTVVCIDRDGTVNRNFPEAPVYDIRRFELLPGAAEAIRRLNEHGLKALLVTNQGGIRHRERDFDWPRYRAIEARLDSELQAAGARVEGHYICPHADYEGCDCRKPKTGLLRRAQEEHGFTPADSYMIGDSAADIIAGADFGMRTILVTSGWEKDVAEDLAARGYYPEMTLPDLRCAVQHIIEWVEQAYATK